MENFFQLVGIFSKSPRILEMIKVSMYPGAGGDRHWLAESCDSRCPMGSVQAVQISTEKEAKQGPETMPPQDPEKPKATPGPQLFTRRQCLSETEEQQDPQPVWDKEPTFWSDTLTQELWKLFRENQQAQEGEGPSLTGCGECLGCPGKPHCSLSLLPPHWLSWR